MKIESDFYKLYLTGYRVAVNSDSLTEVFLEFKTALYGEEPDFDKFAQDITLINTIRNSTDPAVKDVFEKLLTTMALTKIDKNG